MIIESSLKNLQSLTILSTHSPAHPILSHKVRRDWELTPLLLWDKKGWVCLCVIFLWKMIEMQVDFDATLSRRSSWPLEYIYMSSPLSWSTGCFYQLDPWASILCFLRPLCVNLGLCGTRGCMAWLLEWRDIETKPLIMFQNVRVDQRSARVEKNKR